MIFVNLHFWGHVKFFAIFVFFVCLSVWAIFQWTKYWSNDKYGELNIAKVHYARGKLTQREFESIRKSLEMKEGKRNGSRWSTFKQKCEIPGIAFLVLGILILIISPFQSLTNSLDLLGISLGVLSFGLGLIAVGMGAQSDLKYTELLLRIDDNVRKVLGSADSKLDSFEIPPELLEKVLVKPPLSVVRSTGYADVGARVKVVIPEDSKAKAQSRLDEDTKKVGFVRGELQKNDNGTWGIAWGGKYPL